MGKFDILNSGVPFTMDSSTNYVKLPDGSVQSISDLADLETTEVGFIGHKSNIRKAELTDRNISVLDEKINSLQTTLETEISTAVTNLVNGAPGALNTLKELADAINDDASFATTVTNALAGKLDSSSYTASDILTKIKTVDGSGSGLDADTLDGHDSTYFASASNLSSHTSNTSNPHSVTATQVGLGNVDNTSDANKPISTATQTALNLKADQSTTYTKTEVDTAISAATPTFNTILNKPSTISGYGISDAYTKTQVDTNISSAINNLVNGAPTALNTLKELADAINDDSSFASTVTTTLGNKVDKTTTVNGHALSGNVTVTASDVGLGNIDNTSDLNKPISTATQTALDGKANVATTISGYGITDAYTKTDINNLASNYAPQATTYTKTEVNNLATNYALLNSPTFTGSPTLPTGSIATTQVTTDSSTNIATTAFSTPRTGTTGASVIPAGTTAQRPASPVNGYLRYNSDLVSMEAYVNGAWGSVGGGATGGGTDHVFQVSGYTINSSYMIPAGTSAIIVGDSNGDVHMASGTEITFENTSSRLVVL